MSNSSIYSSKGSLVYQTFFNNDGMASGEFRAVVTPGKPIRLFHRRLDSTDWLPILNRYAKRVILRAIKETIA